MTKIRRMSYIIVNVVNVMIFLTSKGCPIILSCQCHDGAVERMSCYIFMLQCHDMMRVLWKGCCKWYHWKNAMLHVILSCHVLIWEYCWKDVVNIIMLYCHDVNVMIIPLKGRQDRFLFAHHCIVLFLFVSWNLPFTV